MLDITDLARDKLQELLGQHSGKYLRFYSEGIGWGGPKLGMALDEPTENEEPVSVNGIDVLIADVVKPMVDGIVLDYVKEAGGEGFVLKGAGGGGCGDSCSC